MSIATGNPVFNSVGGDISQATVVPTGSPAGTTGTSLSDFSALTNYRQPFAYASSLSSVSTAAQSAVGTGIPADIFSGTKVDGEYAGNESYGLGAFNESTVTGSTDTAFPQGITCFGYGAGGSLGNTGAVTAVGYRALTMCTSAQNTAVGASAGQNVTTGHENAYFGSHAGRCNTTGVGNSAFGHGSQGGADDTTVPGVGTKTVTTGQNNTSFGAWSLQAVSSGDRNTALGALAGWSLTEGSDNICIGTYALHMSTIVSDCLAIGTSALSAYTGSSPNVAIGANSGSSLTTGGSNTFLGTNTARFASTTENSVIIGNGAGYSLTTASRTTIIGYQAGTSITTGDNNTAIGSCAGWGGVWSNNVQSVTDHDCVWIGQNATRDNSVDQATTLENMIVIGSNATGDLSNTVFLGGTGTTAAYLGGTSTTGDRLLTQSMVGKAGGVMGYDASDRITKLESGLADALTRISALEAKQ